MIFWPKKQRIYNYFFEFASEALHIIIFENFVKSMTSCLLKLEVTPKFCFPFKIPNDPTASNLHFSSGLVILEPTLMKFLFSIQDVCLVFSLIIVFLSFFSTYIFQVSNRLKIFKHYLQSHTGYSG